MWCVLLTQRRNNHDEYDYLINSCLEHFPRMASKKENRRRACKTCNSGVCHDCCNCRQRTRGRPRKQLKLQMASALAMSMGIVAESVVPWSISTVHPAAPLPPQILFSFLLLSLLLFLQLSLLLFLQLSPLMFLQLSLLMFIQLSLLLFIHANVPAAVPATAPTAVPATVHTAVLLLFQLMSHHVMLIMVAGIPYSKY